MKRLTARFLAREPLEDGPWNVIVREPDFTPSASYNGGWSYTLTSDTFNVTSECAIPKFPTVITAIAAFTI